MRAGFVTQDPETGLYGMGPVALEFSLSCLATIEPIALAARDAERHVFPSNPLRNIKKTAAFDA